MNQELVNIRKVKKEDARQWFVLLNKVWRNAYSHIFPEEVFEERDRKIEEQIKIFCDFIKNTNEDIAYVAEYKGKIIGLMRGSIKSTYDYFHDDYADLIALYIDPEYQNLGIGSSLKKIFEDWAKENGATKYVIGVLKDNIRARKVYESWNGMLSEHEQPFIKLGVEYSEKFYTYNLNTNSKTKYNKENTKIVKIMKKISLYVPSLEDYWYEAKLQSDPDTMSYNAGYDVSYYGYHYDTGCIDFPECKWKETLEKRKREKRFFAYIKDNELNEYVGYCNYHYNNNEDRYECGLVIESKYRGKGYSKEALKLLCDTAKAEGIKSLYDNFEIDRGNTLNLFKNVGFKIIEEQTWKKFGKEVKGVLVKIDL